MTIGYGTVNNCLAVKRTPNNTSFQMMFEICINEIIKGDEIEKYKTILLNCAKQLDEEGNNA